MNRFVSLGLFLLQPYVQKSAHHQHNFQIGEDFLLTISVLFCLHVNSTLALGSGCHGFDEPIGGEGSWLGGAVSSCTCALVP